MRWVLPLLLGILVTGCLQGPAPAPRAAVPADVGFDPTTIRVLGVQKETLSILGADGTRLSAVAYVPQTQDAGANGSVVRWPVVVFMHGWGGEKEGYEGARTTVPGAPIRSSATDGVNRLERFAKGGILAIAYDARGFGQSQGATTVAGPAEMADLGAVIDFATKSYATNGRVGVVGASYGGGQAYLAWAKDPRVTTAVAMYGWVDLYNTLLPNNVPKLEWAQLLYAHGALGSRARYDPMIHSWYEQIYTRSDLATVRKQMDERSALNQMPAVRKPLFVCQGMQESLFPQTPQAWQAAGGFVRAEVFTGGHGANDATCWAHALSWMQFFLGGYDTRVDGWPALQTVDASGKGGSIEYNPLPTSTVRTYHPRFSALDEGPASHADFTIRQQVLANPLQEPAALWDLVGGPHQAIPAELRQDPAASVFTSAPLGAAGVILGEPNLRLHVKDGIPPYQVAATLYLLRGDGSSLLVSRGAAAALNTTDLANGFLEVPMTWTRLATESGDRLQLKIASNDPSWWMPLLANYAVTFDGTSTFDVPFET